MFGSSGAITRAWHAANSPDSLPPWYTEVGQLERDATELREYQPVIFPGQVQHCATLFGVLQAEALSPRASRELIRKVKEELDGAT